ncbi:MAG: DNA polymerase III subunit gamma/tau [Acidimicrobiales bacterium]|jgi:DNA polymerase-3 subunit gamma/tau|nr:DNA polymerase III subunit gamma/tau [Acidimicrobiales bacterium]HLV90834.1 DNA polymerase III subunit gamma/tau [Acidimicrobiia bacterium]
MEYQALYRKYRPQTFDEVIGQGHVTTTLAREVAEGRVAHAYLFAGPRGTGKTTTARILAKALNCENRGKDGTPCNECGSCLAITEGSSLDVLELDAASHNSVDDIRDIRISVTTVASVETSKRVFVLDEAHMLSKAAGNALLKTLEEPPDHVIFVLATTEPYKLLDTIRSRTQRFDFHPVSIDELAGYLSTISDREGYKAEPAALVSIARHAGGSVRDSLSLLEQVAALGSGKVDAPGVRRALGLSDADAMMTLARAVAENDAKAALGLVAEMAGGGVDLRRFVSEAIGFFRGVFLAQYAPNLAEISDEAEDIHDMWMKAAEIVPRADVLRAIDLLSDALVRLREGREERLMTELALIKMTRPETATDPEALISRMDRIERRLRGETLTGATPAAAPAPASAPAPAAAETAPAAPVAKPPTAAAAPVQPDTPAARVDAEESADAPAIDVSLENLVKVWPGLFGSLKDLLGARRWALFKEAVPAAVEGRTIILEVPAGFHLNALKEDDAVARVVATKAGDLLGTQVRITFRARGSDATPSSTDQIDLDDLEERPTADPETLLATELGARVVEE